MKNIFYLPTELDFIQISFTEDANNLSKPLSIWKSFHLIVNVFLWVCNWDKEPWFFNGSHPNHYFNWTRSHNSTFFLPNLRWSSLRFRPSVRPTLLSCPPALPLSVSKLTRKKIFLNIYLFIDFFFLFWFTFSLKWQHFV